MREPNEARERQAASLLDDFTVEDVLHSCTEDSSRIDEIDRLLKTFEKTEHIDASFREFWANFREAIGPSRRNAARMSDLKEFQSAAVARICERLDAKNGSQRFLLADEVGLGKTMVARGVLDRARRGATHGRKGLVCVYLCSNLEIAEQNRDKLTDEEEL